MADIFLFDTSVYIANIRDGAYSDFVDRATGNGRVVLSSVVAMELYAGARSTVEKRLLDRYVASMKRMAAYEVPGEDDWAKGGILVERFTRFRGHARIRDHFRDILVILSAVNRGAVLVSTNRHLGDWGKILKRQGDAFRCMFL